MKRFWRWVLNGLALFSLLLCVAAGIVWVRSYWVADQFFWIKDRSPTYKIEERYTINCTNGGVQIWHMYAEYPSEPPVIGYWFTHESKRSFGYENLYLKLPPGEWMSRKDLQIKGFEITYDREGVDRVQSVTFSLGMIFLVTLLLTAVRVRQEMKRRRRFMKGHCPGCGYDLRATPERCPECGMIPVKTT